MTDWRDRFLLGLLILIPTGCATMMALDPVQTPPTAFRSGTEPMLIEFYPVEQVALRCIERGVPILANACTGKGLTTMPEPRAFSDDAYARILDHETAHQRGWDSAHRTPPPPASASPEAMALNR